MSARTIKRLAAAVALAGGLAGAAPAALAAVGSSGPPQPVSPPHSLTRTTPADNGASSCNGGTPHRMYVATDDNPRYFTGANTITQKFTTYTSQGDETLVISFAGETYADATLAWLQADVDVDGVGAEPYDTINPNAMKSGATYADASLTRCIRVHPGVHYIHVNFKTVGTGYAWVDDWSLQVGQYD